MINRNGQAIAIFTVALIALAYVFRGAFNSKIAVEHFKDKLLDCLERKQVVITRIDKASSYSPLLQSQVFYVELVTIRGNCIKGFFVVGIPFLGGSSDYIHFRKQWKPKYWRLIRLKRANP